MWTLTALVRESLHSVCNFIYAEDIRRYTREQPSSIRPLPQTMNVISFLPMILQFLLVFATAAAYDWAVIIAGSSGYWNYRHQAAAASAYHYFQSRGIPKDRIIVFMSRSVVDDEQNPFVGKLFSSPGNDVEDQMNGIQIDYETSEMTASNVLNVLSGNSFSTKRVLRSSAFDNVYVSFFCYGAPGVITLPNDAIFAPDLLKTLQYMQQKRMYKELVLMIDGEGTEYLLSDSDRADLHIRMISPFTEKIPTRNLFCPPEDIVHHRTVGSCLNTEFSYRLYEGRGFQHSFATDIFDNDSSVPSAMMENGWNGYNTRFEYFRQLLRRDPRNVALRGIVQEEDNVRDQLDEYIRIISSIHKMGTTLTQISEWSCYKRGVEKMERLFFWNEYSFSFFSAIANMCEQNQQSF